MSFGMKIADGSVLTHRWRFSCVRIFSTKSSELHASLTKSVFTSSHGRIRNFCFVSSRKDTPPHGKKTLTQKVSGTHSFVQISGARQHPIILSTIFLQGRATCSFLFARRLTQPLTECTAA